MKRFNDLPERSFLKLFFLFFSLSFLTASFLMPDRSEMLPGLWRILSQPTKAYTNFFAVGGFSATFLNMGLVGLCCTGLYCIPGEKDNSTATLVTILTTGFGSWGIHILNMWFPILGVVLYCILKKERMGSHTNAMLFSTGIAPFISEFMVRYPNEQVVGFRPEGVLLALMVGLFMGVFLPAGLDNSPLVHKGYDIYSAALPVGMSALLIQGFLYRAVGVPVPLAVADIAVTSRTIANTFCLCLFSSCILVSILMGCRPRQYWKLVIEPEFVRNFSATYGNRVMLMNVGLYGLYILMYYNLIDAPFNGITFGVMFCMLSTCNSGSHPANIWPIMLGYALASHGTRLISSLLGMPFVQTLDAQNIIVGICYANGLSPISDHYGWRYGMVASIMHFFLVTTIPLLHGDMCLYNGGFTAALVCLLMVPGLERHFKPKQERRALRRAARKNIKS